MANGRYATWNDEQTPAINGRCSGIDGYTPDMETTSCCRSLLMSRLKAAELLNSQLTTNPPGHMQTGHHPSSRCSVDLAIEQLRAQLVVLIGMDIEVIRQLLDASEQMEEVKWQRKFGRCDSSCTPSTYLSGSCTIDIDSNDLDQLLEHSTSKYATMSSVSTYRGSQDELTDRLGHLRFHRRIPDIARHVDESFLDDAADDVFQADEGPKNELLKPDILCQSRDPTVQVAQSDVKARIADYGKDKVKSSKVEIRIQGVNDRIKLSGVEFKVNNFKDLQDDTKRGRTEMATSYVEDIKARMKTSKVEFKVDNPKEGSLSKKLASSKVEIRFKLHPKDGGRPEDGNQLNQSVDASRRPEVECPSEFPTNKHDIKYGHPGMLVSKMAQPNPDKEVPKAKTNPQLRPKPGQVPTSYFQESKHATKKDPSIPVTSETRTERKEIIVVHL